MIAKYWKYILVFVLMLVSAATGRFVGPDKIVTKTVTVEVEKIHENVKTDIVSKTVIAKDGTKTITTHTRTEQEKTLALQEKTSTKTEQDKTKNLNIYALAGYDFKGLNPVYGAGFSKQWLGPISIGIWGLSDLTFGVSVGLQF